ncbi:MAG: hypothetical protein GWN82_04975, partial [Gemmatimonadetes bacterium]|nr:hypothetical protein [Actinomycetota bacterium]NIU30087.1 hypothetical protein [Gemmatimonadota bacterium]NIT98285.1 hypothetical protein [Actinomycetota bacterium]NIU70347.1 hypothetical protein [Actinomycetota bacterium]NIW32228.1 hypothetical protein [Actinomycetota bacterium]
MAERPIRNWSAYLLGGLLGVVGALGLWSAVDWLGGTSGPGGPVTAGQGDGGGDVDVAFSGTVLD